MDHVLEIISMKISDLTQMDSNMQHMESGKQANLILTRHVGHHASSVWAEINESFHFILSSTPLYSVHAYA